jgi:hypothetical protein
MNYWRMSFRIGSRGDEMWPVCQKRGIAAIGYFSNDGRPIVKDCSKITVEEYNNNWRQKDPRNITGRSSLRKVAYEMKIGDVIYAKQGTEIVGRGKITSTYKYDPSILKGSQVVDWHHYVKVDWEKDFQKVSICLGAELTTVLQLKGERLHRLKAALASANRKSIEDIVAQDLAALNSEETYPEGPSKGRRYVNYYERNPELRKAATQIHGFRCTICGFDFKEYYGERGREYIEAHHLRPVSSCDEKTLVNPKTEMTVVCANCHRMMHRRKDNVLSPQELKKLIVKAKRE